MILENCKGKGYCTLDVPNNILRQGAYTKIQYVFAQVGCAMTEDQLVKKNHWGLVVACIGVFMCLTMRFTIDYIRNRDAINSKLFNMGLISAEKFTVVGRISNDMYKNFKKNESQVTPKNQQLLAHMITDRI